MAQYTATHRRKCDSTASPYIIKGLPVFAHEYAKPVRLPLNEQNPEYSERYGFDELMDEEPATQGIRVASSEWAMVDPELRVVEIDNPELVLWYYNEMEGNHE